jgi:hypothetical protein
MMKNKLVAVMNKQVEVGVVMNALAHMSAGFGAHIGKEQLELMDYVDSEQNVYPNISRKPFIILRAKNSNKILALMNSAKENNLHFSVFTNTMTVGTWQDQDERTKQLKQDEIQFYGIILYGPETIVSELTRKNSLWK